MNQSSQIILAAPPDRIQAAAAYGKPLAHMAYRLGKGPHLFRAQFPAMPKGGLMLIGEEGFDGQGDGSEFCREVLRECTARNFGGIVFDPECPPTQTLASIISTLSREAQRRGLSFYLPESYGNYSNSAGILISSAISGGTLKARLEEAVSRYGAKRVTLCIDRSAEDFYLPAPQGSGRRLTRDELHRRIETLDPSVFFSRELCAHYFTYMSRDTGAHFILFDDVGSIQQKFALAEEVGIHRFFLFYDQMDDLLPQIFGRVGQSVSQ